MRLITARNMERITRLGIVWTSNLADYVRAFDIDIKVAIFHQTSLSNLVQWHIASSLPAIHSINKWADLKQRISLWRVHRENTADTGTYHATTRLEQPDMIWKQEEQTSSAPKPQNAEILPQRNATSKVLVVVKSPYNSQARFWRERVSSNLRMVAWHESG